MIRRKKKKKRKRSQYVIIFGGGSMEGSGGRDGGRRGDHSTESTSGGVGGQGGGSKNISKVSKISITVIAQTTGAVISFHFSDASPLRKPLLVSTLFTNLLGYLSSLSSISLVDDMPEVANILGVIGIVASVLGFIQMIALSLPANIVWIVVLPCLGFLLLFVMVVCIAKFVMKGQPQNTPLLPRAISEKEESVEAQFLNGRPRADEEEPVEAQVLYGADEEEPGECKVRRQVLSGWPRVARTNSPNTAQLIRRNPGAISEEDHPIYGKVLHEKRRTLPSLKKLISVRSI